MSAEPRDTDKLIRWLRGLMYFETADAIAALDANVTLLAASVASMQRENDALREALRPFSEALDCVLGEQDSPDNMMIWDTGACEAITVGDLRRARAALAKS